LLSSHSWYDNRRKRGGHEIHAWNVRGCDDGGKGILPVHPRTAIPRPLRGFLRGSHMHRTLSRGV